MEAICKILPKRYKKSTSSYHTQTGYISFLFKTHQFCLKPIVFCLKPIVFCLKPIVFCLKPIIFSLKPIVFCLITKIYERKYKKSASSFHTQTAYINALDSSGKSFYLKASWDKHLLCFSDSL